MHPSRHAHVNQLANDEVAALAKLLEFTAQMIDASVDRNESLAITML